MNSGATSTTSNLSTKTTTIPITTTTAISEQQQSPTSVVEENGRLGRKYTKLNNGTAMPTATIQTSLWSNNINNNSTFSTTTIETNDETKKRNLVRFFNKKSFKIMKSKCI